MKCQICKKKTTWDESYGKTNFIVCFKCFERLAKKTGKKFPEAQYTIISIIFEIADIKNKSIKEE